MGEAVAGPSPRDRCRCVWSADVIIPSSAACPVSCAKAAKIQCLMMPLVLQLKQYHLTQSGHPCICVFDFVMLLFCCLSVLGKKASTKAPKIQRLVTPLVLQRKRHRLAQKRRRATKKREEAAEYQKLLAQRLKEAKERKLERRRTHSHSKSSVTRTDSVSSAGKKWGWKDD